MAREAREEVQLNLRLRAISKIVSEGFEYDFVKRTKEVGKKTERGGFKGQYGSLS